MNNPLIKEDSKEKLAEFGIYCFCSDQKLKDTVLTQEAIKNVNVFFDSYNIQLTKTTKNHA